MRFWPFISLRRLHGSWHINTRNFRTLHRMTLFVVPPTKFESTRSWYTRHDSYRLSWKPFDWSAFHVGIKFRSHFLFDILEVVPRRHCEWRGGANLTRTSSNHQGRRHRVPDETLVVQCFQGHCIAFCEQLLHHGNQRHTYLVTPSATKRPVGNQLIPRNQHMSLLEHLNTCLKKIRCLIKPKVHYHCFRKWILSLANALRKTVSWMWEWYVCTCGLQYLKWSEDQRWRR
jgi:hypothetical protein